MIAEIAVCLDLDQTLDYRVPEGLRPLVRVGQRVRVPVREQRDVDGFIVGLKEHSSVRLLREISSIVSSDPVVSERDLQLARWISDYYLAPLGLVLAVMAPALRVSFPRTVSYVRSTLSVRELIGQIESLQSRAPQQAALLRTLLSLENPTVTELLERVGCGPGPLKALAQAGLVTITKRPRPRVEFQEAPKRVSLSPRQQQAIEEIRKALTPDPSPVGDLQDRGDIAGVRAFLLHGVNGSGKTEVYLHACQQCVRLNGQAIVLVPEISLTPQFIARFRHYFGDTIAVYHSGLTDSERARQWHRIASGEAQIAIGVRAAIFAPFENLRLIIIDEEHESTYKQDDLIPRYHLRDVALQRARLHNAVTVLGSATPSIESYFRAQQGEYRYLALPERVVPGAPPRIEVLDLGEEKSLISPLLRKKIAERLEAREQIILLLNRLGYASALCARCRETLRCPQCQIALTFSLRDQALRCRYCGYTQRHLRCPRCRGRELIYVGGGTERLELELRRAFPHAVMRRMDSESVRRGEHAAILELFRQGQIQILLGTQMIALGLDFPNVTLVGIVNADTLLDFPDFRAGERTFQVISQAAGRAGRGEKPSEVLIQTRHPEHPAIQLAARQDYRAFYELEIPARRELGYPPFAHLIEVTVEHSNATKAQEQARLLAQRLQSESVEILGPTPAMPARRRGRSRWTLLLKSKSAEIQTALRAAIKALKLGDSVTVNVDPQL
ncbi:MAG: primosomal protein N' [Candidatus Bipolaricaulota bacterium]|nr:primosomal protein N' [Candidatus Bipolaricaulota bacterium]MCS7275392.1 primosomal protein N' [Candidatus Bipolaricaulota bacterium]MDW8110109.1 primosomal protein N' [Candidatus Bipolaricaulota bacterium]MDW8328971.1 primosomal protein N' [Candidatus Bipolaricaulota bacterium]